MYLDNVNLPCGLKLNWIDDVQRQLGERTFLLKKVAKWLPQRNHYVC